MIQSFNIHLDIEVLCLLLRISNMKLYHKIAILSISMMTLTLVVTSLLIFKSITENIEKDTAHNALIMARMVAKIPAIQDAILSDTPSKSLQPIVEDLRHASGAALIVVFDMQEVRLAHPVASSIGTSGADPMHAHVLNGEEFVYSGGETLAPTLRANVPIYAKNNGQQVGFVTVGFYRQDINTLTLTAAREFFFSFMVGVFCCLLGSIILANHVKQATFGWEPHEIATILKERDATLEVIREGVVAVDTKKCIKLLNSEATKILGVRIEEMIGESIDGILPENKLADVMLSRQAIYDEEQRLHDKIILSNSIPIIVGNKVVGAVISFRDRTEINQLAEEITGIHSLVDTLRAQAHEFKNKMHTVGGLIQLQCYQEALYFAVGSKTGMQVQMSLLNENIKDSVISGLLLGKESQIKELKIDFSIDPNSYIEELPVHVTSGDIVLIIGNLLQNSMEALNDCEQKSIWVSIIQEAEVLRIKVRNSGSWIDKELVSKMYQAGITTKKKNNGLGLALIKEKLGLIQGSIESKNLSTGGVEFEVCIPYWNSANEYD
jgi:sensor histidine kinase regulating citrate/malate metabolism